MTTYVCQKLTDYTERGNKWELSVAHTTGARTLLGFHKTRKVCITVARVLAGRQGKIEVREKRERITAWRVA
ncbi:hypothetical protein C7I87_00775 [Mesorhizobium sp. SARCC-RB16n]|uniref:hypothetical protein n=1 Tax=Mesorhizobium sp. SARCC-RB16n TaxID=2116687 RepID=UPI00122F7781|nr:hypothetical protein [Mesorhizobium sp. SARCC-RB16n]KAA3452745.1 hypothetical protein C7I87_00775 [Mesorhizobium sp. SARCC-RB16n]